MPSGKGSSSLNWYRIPDLDAAGRALIEEQYGMKGGSKIVRVRQCMLAYFLKRYHLEGTNHPKSASPGAPTFEKPPDGH